MRNLLIAVLPLAALALPAGAMADEGGVAAGAVTGAVAGGIVGGPIGAAVGAGVGGIAGGAASGPGRPETVYVAPGRAAGGAGCATKTVRTENSYGESRTTITERCD